MVYIKDGDTDLDRLQPQSQLLADDGVWNEDPLQQFRKSDCQSTAGTDAACGKKLIAVCFLRQSEDDGDKRLPPIPGPRPPGAVTFGEITDNRLI